MKWTKGPHKKNDNGRFVYMKLSFYINFIHFRYLALESVCTKRIATVLSLSLSPLTNFINLLGMLGIDGILMQWDWIEWDVDGRLHVYHAWSNWVSLTMLKYCFITRSMCGITFEFMLKWDVCVGCVCVNVCWCGSCGIVHNVTVELLVNELKMCSHLVWPFHLFFSLSTLLSHSAFVLSSSTSTSSSLQWLGIFSTSCGCYDITIHTADVIWSTAVHIHTTYAHIHTSNSSYSLGSCILIDSSCGSKHR